jgi:hypothetical protein
MKGLRFDVFLTRGKEELVGECLTTLPDGLGQTKDLLRRVCAEVVSKIESGVASGKWDCGLYLEVFQVPEALAGWWQWRDVVSATNPVSLVSWKGGSNGQQRNA